MEVLFTKLFLKDINKITDKNLKSELKLAILKFETSINIIEIANIKKMKGHKTAFRLRIGKYRLGFHFDGQTIKLTRFLKRNDIYNLFP